MPYDLFISYSRRDNERGLAAPKRRGGGQVTALKAQFESSFRAFAGRDLRACAAPERLSPRRSLRRSQGRPPQAGEQALQQAHVRQTLEQLHASVRERLDRGERSRGSPNNLFKHNPAFIGRVRELPEADAFNLGKCSVGCQLHSLTPN